MLNRYTRNNEDQTGVVVLNGTTYNDTDVESVKADKGNKTPSDFVCANSYTVTLYNPEEDKEAVEKVYRKDSDGSLVEFLADIKFPG